MPWRLLLIVAIVAAGAAIAVATPLGDRLGPHGLDGLAGTVWAAPALVALYLFAFGFGIPGSALFVAGGLVFPPAVAAGLAVVGATGGSLIAHAIGRALSGDARARWRRKRGFALLERSVDFSGILTLRFLPFFPHSVVNYGSGILAVPLAAFLPATAIGLGVKAFVYGRVAHMARSAEDALDFARADVWGLLFALAALSFLARWAARRRAAAAGLPAEALLAPGAEDAAEAAPLGTSWVMERPAGAGSASGPRR